MRAFNKFLAASAVALSTFAMSAPAHALVSFGSASPTSAPAFSWVRDADQVGGTLTGVADTWFFFETLSGVTGLGALQSEFSFSATTDQAATCAVTCTNAGLVGTFAYIYTGPDVNYSWFGNARTLRTGDTILSAEFNGSWLQGMGSAGSADLSTADTAGSVTNVQSDIFSFGNTTDFDFSFTLTNGNFSNPGAGKSFGNFTAGSSGSFAAGVIPEPGTWALMIMGFGGAGAMLRSRRKTLVAA